MKQLLALLAIVGMITFASCNGTSEVTEEETEEITEEAVEEMVEEMSEEEMSNEEMLAEHVCTDQCTKDNHAYLHGETGHVCDESCGAM